MNKKGLLVILCFLLCLGIVGCKDKNKTEKYTVTFYVEGQKYFETTVEKGRRIEVTVNEPKFNDSEKRFNGWYKEEAFTNQWIFGTDIVTSNLSLYAGYIIVSDNVSNITGINEGLVSGLTWMQAGLTLDTDVVVTLYPYLGQTAVDGNLVDSYDDNGTIIDGVIEISGETITWKPTTEPVGGKYKVSVKTGENDPVMADGIWFKGEGTVENPFLVVNATDLSVITTTEGTVGSGKYYKLVEDFKYDSDYNLSVKTTFAGNLDGNGKTIELSGNSGIFYNIANNAVLSDITIIGAISTAKWAGIGALANNNEGTIINCISYANVSSQVDIVARPDQKEEGGAGGLVGINKQKGIIEKSTFSGTVEGGSNDGVVKATNGGGGIAGTNYGKITECINKGCLGAFNSVESGKSLSAYSYNGGIAGYNYGTIEKSGTESIGKLLAQRALSSSTAVTYNNIAIGGVVGYNAENAVIDQCYFEGIRVHGDQAVGGIAGINAGTISSSYASGKYYSSIEIRSYVGGRLEVGGIAGRVTSTSVIANCYSTANVFAYETTAYSIAEKASNSVANNINSDSNTLNSVSLGSTPVSNTLVQPIGENNQVISNTVITEADVNAKISETYLSTLGVKFAYSSEEETIRLRFELDNLGDSYVIEFYDGETLINSFVIYENAPEPLKPLFYTKDNYEFLGWSLTVDGEVEFNLTSDLTYQLLTSYIASGSALKVYAVLQEEADEPTTEVVIGYLSGLNITTELAENLKTGFLAYCLANQINVQTVTLVEFSDTKIADYTAAIANNGNIDIVIGVGNNINTNDSSVIKDYILEKVALNIETNSGRYAVSLVTGPNKLNAESFLAFIATDEANDILNPPITERTDSLVVAIFARYCSTEISSALKVAFEEYLESQNINVTVTFIIIEATAVKDVVDQVLLSETPIDIVLGGGANINTSSGSTTNQTLSGSKTSVTISGSDRNALLVTDCANLANATTFIEFLTLDTTKEILNPTA